MQTAVLSSIVTKDIFLQHWLGHRRLTRRTIDAFPQKELFEFSIGGMRTFAELMKEIITIAGPSLKCFVDNIVKPYSEEGIEVKTKDELLKRYDEETKNIIEYYNQLPEERFSEMFNLFEMYNNTIVDSIFYFIDNEIHHRAQGFVYLRALGIEPPAFYER